MQGPNPANTDSSASATNTVAAGNSKNTDNTGDAGNPDNTESADNANWQLTAAGMTSNEVLRASVQSAQFHHFQEYRSL